MSTGKGRFDDLWATVEEKACLMEAATLLLSSDWEGRRYLRPLIACACALALCLLPMVSAGEEASAALIRLAW